MAIIPIPEDKEYYVVESLRVTRRTLTDAKIYHDKLKGLRGMMTIELEALTPVFVGTGDYEYDEDGIYQPFAQREGRLIIPGASLKGVIRSYAEALSPSCEAGKRSEGRKCDDKNLCICCSIFGCLGFMGRISFFDAELVKPVSSEELLNIELRWGQRNRDWGGRRFYPHHSPDYWLVESGGEWVETVKTETKFRFNLNFQNLEPLEIGLILLAMGLSPQHPFDLKLGGGKNRGLGSVRFSVTEPIKLFPTPKDAYQSFSARPKDKQMACWGEKAVQAYLSSCSQKVREIIEELIGNFGKLNDEQNEEGASNE